MKRKIIYSPQRRRPEDRIGSKSLPQKLSKLNKNSVKRSVNRKYLPSRIPICDPEPEEGITYPLPNPEDIFKIKTFLRIRCTDDLKSKKKIFNF